MGAGPGAKGKLAAGVPVLAAMPIAPPSPDELIAFTRLRTTDDLADFLGTTLKRLTFHLYSKARPRYKLFRIPKAAGGERLIAAPPQVIKIFQKRVLACMTALVVPKGPAHGFILKKSVVTNAMGHVGKGVVLNIDLLDFFHSIHFGRIRGVFRHQPFGFSAEVAAVLAQMCSHNGYLPPGAPTSPMMSNLICRGLDKDLLALARKNRCRYTRYADDITFSTRLEALPPTLLEPGADTPSLGHGLLEILAAHDFQANLKKLHVRGRDERQEVTGLVVNQKVNVRRRYIRNLRALLHDWEQRGLSSAEERFQQTVGRRRRRNAPRLATHLQGRLAYLKMVKGRTDKVYLRYALRLERLASSRKFGVSIEGRHVLELSILIEAIWIVLGYNADGNEVKQGTAFALDEIGLVTAAHVFDSDDNDPAVTWKVLKASSTETKYVVKGWQVIKDLDLAIIDTDAIHGASVTISERLVTAGDEITIAGFPNWFSPADGMELQSVKVTQTKVVHGRSYILTSANVREGASGGPMLDSFGAVVGVALAGPGAPISPNGGLAISHLKDLLEKSVKSPLPPVAPDATGEALQEE